MNKSNNRTHCNACTKHCVDNKKTYCTEYEMYISKEAMFYYCSSFENRFKKNNSKNT